VGCGDAVNRPRLRNRLQVVIAVIVEGEGTAERVCNIDDVAEGIVIGKDEIAVAVLERRAMPVATGA